MDESGDGRMQPLEVRAARVRRKLLGESKADAAEQARVVQRPVDALVPGRIYVFGSRAGGEARPDSAVELRVAVAHSDLLPHQRDERVLRAIGPHTMPFDVLVLTHEEFERRRAVVSPLSATVAREGRTFCAA